MPSGLHFFRCRLRPFALLALLAICLQLAASAIGSSHAARQLADGNGAFDICTPGGVIRMAAADGEHSPAAYAGGQHCPFCAASSGLAPLLATALSFFLPEPDPLVFLPAVAAGFQPSAPDLRHAPPRAPPVSLA
ncbi:MAG: DUF2946 family protein [Zoogloeaceae bacterium]|nr:DUF2946 family protein [Zoogloeaceae bacterium]